MEGRSEPRSQHRPWSQTVTMTHSEEYLNLSPREGTWESAHILERLRWDTAPSRETGREAQSLHLHALQ